MRLLTSEGGFRSVSLSATAFIDGDTDELYYSPSHTIELVPGADGTARKRDYEWVYLTNPWLYATIQLKAKGAARMPIKLYRFTGDEGERERIRPNGSGGSAEERRARSLARALTRPGNRTSRFALVKGTSTNANVWGPALWVIERDRYGDYLGFKRIPYRYARKDMIAGVMRYWDSRTPGVRHLADDVIHFGLGSDCGEFDASSPIGALHSTVALYDAIERHLVAYFRNSARLSGHYQVQPGTGKQARAAIREAITSLYTSPENAGKILVTSAKFEKHSETPDHNKVVELAKQSREEIVAVYNMPPPLVGILDRAIMSNVRELRSHYARDVVGPDLALFEGDFDAQVLAQDPLLSQDVFVEFEMAAVMRPDPEARAGTYKDRRLVETLNEIRATENLKRIDHPDADMPWMPLNEAPLGDDPKSSSTEPPLMERTEGDEDDEPAS